MAVIRKIDWANRILKYKSVADQLAGICTVLECERKLAARGVCDYHYYHLMNIEKPKKRNIAPRGAGTVNKKGYRAISVNGKRIKEHRYVMSQMLGRELYPNEEVHHKNGLKADNRSDNLELWVVSQPYGQRVEDLIRWAKEILERYT